MLRSLFSKSAGIPPAKLPQLHSFVDVIAGGRPARSVTVESVTLKGIVTNEVLGKPGEVAVIVYHAAAGRFRAQTKIASVAATSTTYEMPKKVTLIGAAGGGAQKRQSVRLDALVSGQWRFAPNGMGTGEWVKCTFRDISRGGCSLIIDRPLKKNAQVEVKLNLKSSAQPVTLLGEVMRHDVIAASGKHSHGLRFHGIRPAEDQAIVEFINRRQADLRSRGLA